MKLFTFGDSWTEGVGADIVEEENHITLEEKSKVRNLFSWPKQLADILKIDFTNYGVGGCSNKTIFDIVCKSLHNDIIKRNDLVIIMWSSSLRDNVPFFPEDNNFHIWTERYLKDKKYLLSPDFYLKSDNKLYNESKKLYKKFFITSLFNESYYHIVNQNYILYLQFMFENIGIRYVFCDAFDLMIGKEILNEIDKSNFINKNHYWFYKEKTFRDFLDNLNRKELWEDGRIPAKNEGKHPSKIGYKLISEELYNFIVNNNILNYELNKLNFNYL
jgi:lysophospholipase L1-like esterase